MGGQEAGCGVQKRVQKCTWPENRGALGEGSGGENPGSGVRGGREAGLAARRRLGEAGSVVASRGGSRVSEIVES